MNDDAVNMSMRKFLKQVGVTSQREIERALAEAGSTGPVTARMVLTIPELGLEHVVEGQIGVGNEDPE
ncbi:MAG: DUF6494 family protein [Pseudomonadota bacterium]